MRRSEKIGVWTGLFTFIIGGILSLFVFLPWHAPQPHVETLSLPANSEEIAFVEVSLETFQGLQLSDIYYQITLQDGEIHVRCQGKDSNSIYLAEKNYAWNEGYNLTGYNYKDGILTVNTERDLFAYALLTVILFVVAVIACIVLGILFYAIARVIEEVTE